MRNKIVLIFAVIITGMVIINSCQSEEELNYARYFVNGKRVYETHCQNCHAQNGAGLGLLIPPLTDSLFLKRNKKDLSCIIRYGLSGRITINQRVYDGTMPGEDHLSDMEIASVITFITNSFGNKQGLYDINNVAADSKDCK
jgi:mono/diheme cytochrome c family protein